jgi:hypothetical protein
MYINDKRRNATIPFSDLRPGDLFAYSEDDNDVFYLMVVDTDTGEGEAVVLGAKSGSEGCIGRVWTFNPEEEIEPLRGSLEVWAVR